MAADPAQPQQLLLGINNDAKSLTVTLDDGSQVDYIMRGLREDEISAWAAFCASVFAYKANPPPPSYFERHYRHDPQRGDASLIRVIQFQDALVASCRVFQRNISTGRISNSSNNVDDGAGETGTTSATITTFWRGGGIGEVCTDPLHRQRGLSKLLLQDAIRIMTCRNMQLSLLHSAKDFFRVYQSVGYSCSISKWSVASIDMNQLSQQQQQQQQSSTTSDAATSPEIPQLCIRLADFPKDTEQLQAIHHVYSEQRFAGCIVRNFNYWNEYIRHELEGSLWVLTRQWHNEDDNEQEDSAVVAWISVRNRGARYQLREFGCDEQQISTALAFTILLQHALSQVLQLEEGVIDTLDFHLPTFLCSKLGDKLPWLSNVLSEDDEGWMYKSLAEDDLLASLLSPSQPHLIWPSDSF